MCNELKCAIQSTVDLININITRDVQEECANRLYRYVHIAAMRMMENDGRSSSSVSQFLPSRF